MTVCEMQVTSRTGVIYSPAFSLDTCNINSSEFEPTMYSLLHGRFRNASTHLWITTLFLCTDERLLTFTQFSFSSLQSGMKEK